MELPDQTHDNVEVALIYSFICLEILRLMTGESGVEGGEIVAKYPSKSVSFTRAYTHAHHRDISRWARADNLVTSEFVQQRWGAEWESVNW